MTTKQSSGEKMKVAVWNWRQFHIGKLNQISKILKQNLLTLSSHCKLSIVPLPWFLCLIFTIVARSMFLQVLLNRMCRLGSWMSLNVTLPMTPSYTIPSLCIIHVNFHTPLVIILIHYFQLPSSTYHKSTKSY